MRRRPGRPAQLAVVAAVLALAACSGGSQASSPSTSPAATSSAATTTTDTAAPDPTAAGASGAPTASTGAARKPSKLLVVVLENHAPDSVEREMPTLTALGRQYGRATQYYALTHPSLGNYLAIAGGTTFSVEDDGGPAKHPLSGGSVFGQAIAGRSSAKTYAESMPRSCDDSNDGDYAVKHNPWVYFPSERVACQRDDVPSGAPSSGALHDDLVAGRMPNFALLIPDLCSDAHDCDLATSDRWLAPWLQLVRSSPDWKAGRLAVFVTFDEDDHTAGNRITGVLAYPTLHAAEVTKRLDHRDLSASASLLLGGRPLREAAGRAGLLAAFGLA
jgi:phosphatidylinositol-3-phosphatase